MSEPSSKARRESQCPVLLITEVPSASIMLAHDAGGARADHPERPDRLRAIWRALDALPGDLMRRVEPAPADRAALERVHTPEHVTSILAQRGRTFVIDADTAGCPATVDAALVAAGSAVQLVDCLLASSPAPSGGGAGVFDGGGGTGTRAFAIVRPPGHHAEADRAMGFCFFNNIAIAAAHAIAHHKLDRVLIVDWDVHHGNGTQHIFENRQDVLVFNILEHGIWPGTGAIDECGVGEGHGFTVNVPLPRGSGDAEYLAVFHRLLVPIAWAYRPQLVLVSAGFDAHMRDPLGGMNLTEAGFAAMCAVVRGIADETANGRLGLVLEGGYDLEALSSSVAACVRVMGGENAPKIEGQASAMAEEVIERAIAVQREIRRPGGPSGSSPG